MWRIERHFPDGTVHKYDKMYISLDEAQEEAVSMILLEMDPWAISNRTSNGIIVPADAKAEYHIVNVRKQVKVHRVKRKRDSNGNS